MASNNRQAPAPTVEGIQALFYADMVAAGLGEHLRTYEGRAGYVGYAVRVDDCDVANRATKLGLRHDGMGLGYVCHPTRGFYTLRDLIEFKETQQHWLPEDDETNEDDEDEDLTDALRDLAVDMVESNRLGVSDLEEAFRRVLSLKESL